MKKIIAILSIVLGLLMAFAAGCTLPAEDSFTSSLQNSVGSTGSTGSTGNTDPTDPAPIKELTLVVTEETIAQLENYPDLERVDLTGSTCYAAIAQYQAAHPQVEVIYTVALGDAAPANNTLTLTLEPEAFEFDLLLERLQYLPQMTDVTLPTTQLDMAQITLLRETYPQITFTYTVLLGDTVLSEDTTELDLSLMPMEGLAHVLSLLPQLAQVELMDAEGASQFTMEDVKVLVQAAPQALFNYSFELFGQTLNCTDETVAFVNVSIGNDGVAQVRAALDILNRCTYFKLDECGIDNEIMASIRDSYPNTEVVWRIHMSEKSLLTDTDTLRALYIANFDQHSEPLKYLTKVKYIDFGHNESMTDLSFMAYMPELEIVILSGSPITDLSPLANCKKLVFLELAWCGHLKDLSPLAGCESLQYLNIGHTKVSDMSPLYGLNLKVLHYVNSGNRVGMTADNWAAVKAEMPDCWIVNSPMYDNSAFPYGTGWRYNEGLQVGSNFTEIYRLVRKVFNYDYIDSTLYPQS